MLLKDMGLDPTSERARRAIAPVREDCTWGPEFGDSPFFEGEVEPCINGRVLGLGAYFGPASNPDDAKESSRNVVAGKSITSIAASSLAIAAKMDSALRCLSLPSNINAFQSGRRSKRFFGAICPAIIA